MGAPLIVAMRGPIMLVVLGLLFVMDHFGPVSFGRTWPALIIIFGILKLLERSALSSARTEG
jgi:hypothetical protein